MEDKIYQRSCSMTAGTMTDCVINNRQVTPEEFRNRLIAAGIWNQSVEEKPKLTVDQKCVLIKAIGLLPNHRCPDTANLLEDVFGGMENILG